MSGTEITPYEPPADRERPWLALLEPAARLADAIARTDFVPSALRGNTAAITAAVLYGDEVGLPPMQSLAKVHVIEGRPALAAEAQRALILAAGHEVWLENSSSTSVTWAGRRKGSDQVTRIEWTMDDARRAGLDRRPNYAKYPRAMLSARASADLARAVFPDVIGGLMALEELEDVVPGEDGPELPGQTPAKKTTRAKRSRKSPAAASSAARAVDVPDATLPALPGAPDGPAAPKAPKAAAEPVPPPTAPDEATGEPDPGPSLPWPNYYAMKAKEVGLDDDERHALTNVVTEGRTETSGDMTEEERAFAREALTKLSENLWRLTLAAGIDDEGRARTAYRLERKVAGEVEVVRSGRASDTPDTSGPETSTTAASEPSKVSEPSDTDDEPVEGTIVIDEASLRRLMRAKAKRVSDVLKKASEGRGAPSAPRKIADILDEPELAATVVAWLEELEDV